MQTPLSYDQLWREIDEAILSRRLSSVVTFGEASKLAYLLPVIEKDLRNHAAVAIPLERVAPHGRARLGVNCFPAGTVVGASAWVVNYDKAIYDEDADDVPLERWIEATSDQARLTDCVLVFFRQGSRT